MKKLLILFPWFCLSLGLAQEPLKIAVMDLKARQGVDKMVMMSLTDLVCTEISKFGGFEVMGRDDMQAMLEHIADRQLLECDDTKCLAKVGGALGVARLLSGNIGKVGEVYLVNLKLIDIDEARVLARFSKEFGGDESGLIKFVKHAANVVFGRPGLSESELKALEAKKTPPQSPVQLSMEQPAMMTSGNAGTSAGAGKKIFRYTSLTLGGLGIAGAVGLWMMTESKYDDYKATVDPAEAERLHNDIEGQDTAVNVLLGLGSVGILGGVITFVF